MTTDKQMYFDHGSDSFLSEVGQILKIKQVHIDVEFPTPGGSPHTKVKVEFAGEDPNTGGTLRIV